MSKCDAQRLRFTPLGEKEDKLAKVFEYQIPFAERTTCHHLNGVGSTGVVVYSRHEFLI